MCLPMLAAIPVVGGLFGAGGAAAAAGGGVAALTSAATAGTAGFAAAGAGGGLASTLMAASTALTAGSALLGGVSGFEGMQYQSQIAKQNRQQAIASAAEAQAAGDRAETIQRQKTADLIGRQQAQMAANGVDVSSGSAAAVLGDTAKLGEADALTIRQNYYDRIRGLYTDAGNFGAQAALDQAAGANDLLEGGLKAGASALGGASEIASKWGGWQATH